MVSRRSGVTTEGPYESFATCASAIVIEIRAHIKFRDTSPKFSIKNQFLEIHEQKKVVADRSY